MTALLIMVVVGLIAAGAALVVQRGRPAPPTAARGEPPTRLDRADFRSPHAEWLITVFTSASCSSCAAVMTELRGYASADVVVEDVEIGTAPHLHSKYSIESVPTAVIADATGNAKLGFVGPIGNEHRSALATTLGLDDPTN